MNRLSLNTLLPIAGVLLGCVAVLPLLVLSAYNHPSAADDYCFADTAVRYGFWAGQKFYYDGWTGRYFSNMLVHGSPLVWGWYDGFRLIPALSALGLLAALAAFVNELLRGQPGATRAGVTGMLFFLHVLALRSVAEAFFWSSAVASYTVPTALTLYLLAVVLRWYRLSGGWLRSLTTVWAGFLVFATVGSGETNMILLMLLLGMFFGYRLLFQRRFDGFLLTLIGVSLVSAWLLFRAPGNAVRMGGNPHAADLVGSVVSAVGWLATAVPGWLWQTPVLILSVLYVPLGRRLTRPNAPTRALFAAPAALVTLAYAGLLTAMIFPSYYGVGIAPVYRVINVTYLVFLLGWFYTLTVWLGSQVGQRVQWSDRTLVTLGLIGLAGVWLAFSAVYSLTLKTVYTDWLRGGAAQYDREMTDRHRLLTGAATGRDTLRIRPISVHPQSLFLEDIQENPAFLWNRCQAGFYGHSAVVLDTVIPVSR
jgi:hypothetical protein